MFGLVRMPRFIRRFIRRRTAHMAPARALEVKEKLSLAYAFCAWNMLGYLGYMVYTGRWEKTEVEEEGKELSSGRYYAKLLKLQNVQLTQIKGISSMQTFDLSKEEGFGGEEKQDLKGEEEQEDSELLKE